MSTSLRKTYKKNCSKFVFFYKIFSKNSNYQDVYIESLTVYNDSFDIQNAKFSIAIGEKECFYSVEALKSNPSSFPGTRLYDFKLSLIQIHNEYRKHPESFTIRLYYNFRIRTFNQNLLFSFENHFLTKLVRSSMYNCRMIIQILESESKNPPLMDDLSKSLNFLKIKTFNVNTSNESNAPIRRPFQPCQVHVLGNSEQSEGVFYLHENCQKRLSMQIHLDGIRKADYCLQKVLISNVHPVSYEDALRERNDLNFTDFAKNDFIKSNEEILTIFQQYLDHSLGNGNHDIFK